MRPVVDRKNEDGAVLVFTTIVLIVMLGISAIVIDGGALRSYRDDGRAAADLAAVAAARTLSTSGGTGGVAACAQAVAYTNANLQTNFVSSNCGVFAGACDPSTSRTATMTDGQKTLKITNPVTNSSPYMQTSTVGGPTQSARAAIDGQPCERIAVSITQTLPYKFAKIIGVSSGSTTTWATALATNRGGTGGAPAALIVLESSACNALTVSGQAHVVVQGSGTSPAVIVVDSSGTGGSGANRCQVGRYTIDAVGTSNASIEAQTNGTTIGMISLYALAANQGTTAAFDPTDVAGGLVAPQPVSENAPVTRSVVDDRFNCSTVGRDGIAGTTDDCQGATSSTGTIDQLRAQYGGSGAPSGAAIYPRSSMPTDSCNLSSSATPVVLPYGNWFVNCPSGLSISNSFTMLGGNIVTAGSVNVGSQGSLTVNPNGLQRTNLFMRAGDLTKGAQATVSMTRTTAIIQSGVISLGGGSGTARWTPPDDPSDPLRGLSLWSEGSNDHLIGGQSNLTLRGVYFTPNATMVFTGQGGQYQTAAQFISNRLDVKGQGTLTIQPDPTLVVLIPVYGSDLIR